MSRQRRFKNKSKAEGLKSPAFTETSDKVHPSEEFQLELESKDSQASFENKLFDFQATWETQRPRQQGLELEVNNHKFIIDCSDIWKIKKELLAAFQILGLSQSVHQSLKIIILERLAKRDSRVQCILDQQLEEYGLCQANSIDELLELAQSKNK